MTETSLLPAERAQFGDHSGAQRLAELATRVQADRAPVAAAHANALAATDRTALQEVSRGYEAIGDRVAAADASAQGGNLHIEVEEALA